MLNIQKIINYIFTCFQKRNVVLSSPLEHWRKEFEFEFVDLEYNKIE